jgi:hypothetical protein
MRCSPCGALVMVLAHRQTSRFAALSRASIPGIIPMIQMGNRMFEHARSSLLSTFPLTMATNPVRSN